MRELVEMLFPSRCVACGHSGELLCSACASGLSLLTEDVCGFCGNPRSFRANRPLRTSGDRHEKDDERDACTDCSGRLLHFTRARSAVAYRADATRIVAAWKEGGSARLAYVAAEIVARILPRPAVATLTSVPPDRDRTLWRGHDPARSLCRALAREWDHSSTPLLRRVGRVARQRDLSATERQSNLVGAFGAASEVPATVCLVDDVYTTGATASAAAAALQSGGATHVEVVTFARAIRRASAHGTLSSKDVTLR